MKINQKSRINFFLILLLLIFINCNNKNSKFLDLIPYSNNNETVNIFINDTIREFSISDKKVIYREHKLGNYYSTFCHLESKDSNKLSYNIKHITLTSFYNINGDSTLLIDCNQTQYNTCYNYIKITKTKINFYNSCNDYKRYPKNIRVLWNREKGLLKIKYR